jgi:serine/threonine protein phosphatase PrpC
MEFVSNKSHTITLAECAEQMSKGQDFTCSGQTIFAETGESIRYIGVMDGHGSDSCINFIRRLSETKIREIMGEKCPITALQDLIGKENAVGYYESSGATMCLARVFSDHVECLNSGDSQAVVFKNGKMEFITEEHNTTNENERTRLSDESRINGYLISQNIRMVAENKLEQFPSDYATFKNGITLATTQALGHRNVTGIRPDRTVIEYGSSDTIRVIVGSDGLFDMIIKCDDGSYLENDIMEMNSMSCELIVKRAVDRWLQEWEAVVNGETTKFKFARVDCDDVCVVIMDIIPIEPN